MKPVKLRHLKPRFLALLIILPLALLAAGTFGLSNIATTLNGQKNVEQYQWDTQQISNRIQDTINSYSSVLYTGRAFMLNSHVVEPSEWNGFYRNQDAFNRYKGINSISYIKLVSATEKAAFEAQMKSYYGSDFAINPAGNRDVYAVASLSAGTNFSKPTGFDVYSTADRKAVYETAKTNGIPTASGLFNFADGTPGMFIALPVNINDRTDGFVIIALHSKDFFASVIDPSKLGNFAIRVSDVTDPANETELFATGVWQPANKVLGRRDVINFGGRLWQVDYQAPLHYNQTIIGANAPRLILVVGLLLICVIALIFNLFLAALPHYKTPPTAGSE